MKRTVYKSSIDIRKLPKNLDGEDLKLFDHEINKPIGAIELIELKSVFILRDTIFNPFTFKFHTKFTHVTKVSNLSLIKRLRAFLKKGIFIKQSIWIIDNWSTGYFHWFMDALPRYIIAEPFIKDHIVVLPEYYKNVPYIQESLSILNIPFHYFNTSKKVKVGQLLLPGHAAETGNYHKEVVNLLRNKFSFEVQSEPKKNVFVSRRSATKRKIINEDEVIELLKKMNFEIHHFENYNLTTQIQLLANTKILVGLHGAGLTNMLFMHPGTAVLELRNENDAHNNCYFSLASDLDIDYYYQQNKGNTDNTNIVDIIVDINLLNKNINSILTQQHQ